MTTDPTPIPAPAPAPTVESLAAELAAMKAELAKEESHTHPFTGMGLTAATFSRMAKTAALSVWWFLGVIAWPLFIAIVSWAALAYLVDTGRIQLPLPWTPTPAPAPSGLAQAIHDAYASETDASKADHIGKLAAVLTKFTAAAKAKGTAKTVADVFAELKVETTATIGTGSLPKVGAAIGKYLGTKLPTDPDTPMTTALWTKIGTEMSTVAAELNGVH